jgi:hypothetical protein
VGEIGSLQPRLPSAGVIIERYRRQYGSRLSHVIARFLGPPETPSAAAGHRLFNRSSIGRSGFTETSTLAGLMERRRAEDR